MKLYHQPRTRSSRVRWLLGELGIEHFVEQINVFAGEGRRPEYQKVHPHGFVPALEVDGGPAVSAGDKTTVLIESSAICMYLADRYAEAKLAPEPGTLERGKYYEWMVYVPATADPTCETVMFHTLFLPEDKRIPQLADRAKKTWSSKIEPRYAKALASSRYILGDRFTAADVLVASSLAWAKMAGMLSDDPVVAKYLDEMTKRPSFVMAHE